MTKGGTERSRPFSLAARKVNGGCIQTATVCVSPLEEQKREAIMPMRRIHHINQRRVPRVGLVMFAGALWLTLGLISHAAFQLVG